MVSSPLVAIVVVVVVIAMVARTALLVVIWIGRVVASGGIPFIAIP